MMDREQLEKIARTNMLHRKEHKGREPGWIFYHGMRTAVIADELCNILNIEVDRDVIYAGGLFHDVGKGSEHHGAKGAELTEKLLPEHCTREQLAEVCEIVRLHNQRQTSPDHSPAVKIVQDADVLDHVGPIVSWLTFYWSGTHSEAIDEDKSFVIGPSGDKYRNDMRNTLNFKASIAMFDERIRWEDDFFQSFRKVYFEGVWHNNG